jgi:diguanylate cyclase (GGDEF)-like protein
MYQIGRIFEPRHWYILLKNPKSGDLVFSVVVGENKQKLQGIKLAKGEGIAGYIMETGRSLVVEDVSKDPRFRNRVDQLTGFQTRSVIGAPLKTGDKILGVIELINRIGEKPFTEKDLGLFTSIAEYAAIAIERSYYSQTLARFATKDSLTGLLNRWSFEQILGKKDDFKIRYGMVFSLLIIRVDDFDRIVSTRGQLAYDDVVKTIARLIETTKRRNNRLFRYSENIFLILLPQTDSNEAKTTRHRISKAVQAAKHKTGQIPLDIHMTHHTLSSDEIEKLIPLVGEALPTSGKMENSASIPDISENLQSLVAEETSVEPIQEGLSKKFGKAVSLRGHCLYSKSKNKVLIEVERISMTSIAFRVPEFVKIFPRDFLNIHFVLDDLKKSIIQRQVLVLEVDGNYIYADFYNPPPYDKDLGFYVLG